MWKPSTSRHQVSNPEFLRVWVPQSKRVFPSWRGGVENPEKGFKFKSHRKCFIMWKRQPIMYLGELSRFSPPLRAFHCVQTWIKKVSSLWSSALFFKDTYTAWKVDTDLPGIKPWISLRYKGIPTSPWKYSKKTQDLHPRCTAFTVLEAVKLAYGAKGFEKERFVPWLRGTNRGDGFHFWLSTFQQHLILWYSRTNPETSRLLMMQQRWSSVTS